MRLRLVPTLAVAAVAAAALFAAVSAKQAEGFPSRKAACTNCHPAAPIGATVSATPSTTTPAAGGTYTVSISLAGLTSTGDTGYWITNAAGTPATSVYGGATGTEQTSYTQTMTAPSAPGTYMYTVWGQRGSTADGQATSATYTIIVAAPAATLLTLTPSSGESGSSVVITGTDLGTSGTVLFGTTVAITSSWTDTSITCTVPAGLSAGAVDVTVQPTGGAVSNALTYTVTVPTPPPATPSITSLTPGHGLAGDSVTIAGTGLGTGGTVRFGNTAASTSSWSATSITCTVPAGLSAGAVDVSVTPTGGSASNALPFTVDSAPTPPPAPAPAITSLSPASGESGSSVVIAGTDLGTGGTVRFGNTAASTSSWSATSITCTVPAGLSAGAVDVTVTPTGGSASNALVFTVTVPQPPSGDDTTPPATTARVVNGDREHHGGVAVLLRATDSAGGSGVASITYSIDGGVPVTVAGSRAVVRLSDGSARDDDHDGDHDGDSGRELSGARRAAEKRADAGDDDHAGHAGVRTVTITYFATDAAGNVEAAHTLTVTLGGDAPGDHSHDH